MAPKVQDERPYVGMCPIISSLRFNVNFFQSFLSIKLVTTCSGRIDDVGYENIDLRGIDGKL